MVYLKIAFQEEKALCFQKQWAERVLECSECGVQTGIFNGIYVHISKHMYDYTCGFAKKTMAV